VNERHLLLLLVCRGSIFIQRYQGVRNAQQPKDDQEYAPTQIGGVICYPPEAVDIARWQPQSAQKNHGRYLALARAEALIGNTVGAENYYQHAEHYFRLMNSFPRVGR
jgi:hypothetical protein